MRNSLLFLLLVTVAGPAIAAFQDETEREGRREARRAERVERAQARSENRSEEGQERAGPRSERAQPVVRVERAEPVVRIQRPERIERVEGQVEPERQAVRERRGGERSSPRVVLAPDGDVAPPGRTVLAPQREAEDSVRNWRRRDRARAVDPRAAEPSSEAYGDVVQRRIEGRRADNRLAPIISRIPREGTQPPPPARQRPASYRNNHWRGDWRHDRRYDWHDHRRRNRSLFRLGFYFDPFGWGYRPYSIGWRMWPHYYRSNYWLSDPWMYRLPRAYPPYRWVRYHNDAVLVDTWSGEVVDVIYGFFW